MNILKAWSGNSAKCWCWSIELQVLINKLETDKVSILLLLYRKRKTDVLPQEWMEPKGEWVLGLNTL